MSEEFTIDEEKPSPLKITLILGVILGVVSILYNIAFIWTDDVKSMAESNKIYGYIQYFIVFGFGIYAIKWHRDQNLDGEITYGKAFWVSFLTILWYGVVMALFTYFFFKLSPEKIEEIMKQGMKAMELKVDKGEMTDEQFEQSKKWIQMFSSPLMMALGSLMGAVIMGLISSFLAAAFHKLIKSKKA